MADEKQFKEVDLDSDPRSETPFYGDYWDGSGPAGRPGVPTISESELLHNDTKKMVEREFVPDEPNESLSGLLDYYFSGAHAKPDTSKAPSKREPCRLSCK
jgi:hypothetical protein